MLLAVALTGCFAGGAEYPADGRPGRAGGACRGHCFSEAPFDHTDEELTQLLRDGFERGSGPNAPRDVPELIARVARARRDGYALVLDEFGDDLAAAAAPVRDAGGRIIASLNVRAPSYRLEDQLDEVGRKVKAAALHLSRSLTSPVSPADPTTEPSGARS